MRGVSLGQAHSRFGMSVWGAGGRVVVLSPCGVCRERLAVYGPGVLVAVADVEDPTVVVWKPLKAVLPDYWMTVFPDELDAGWSD